MTRLRCLVRSGLVLMVGAAAVSGIESSEAAFPGGSGRIAFQRIRDSAPADQGIVVVNPDGTGLKRLAAHAYAPKWSPDGAQLVYYANDGAGTALFVLAANGGAARKVASGTPGEGYPIAPSWSPDGQKIVFTQERCADVTVCTGQLAILDLGSGVKTPLPNTTGAGTGAEWSPDGTRLLFERRPAAGARPYFTLDEYVLATNTVRTLPGLPTDPSWPSWSPDSRRIAFTSHRTIYLSNADGSGSRPLFRKVGEDYASAGSSSWSPDGKRIVFMASADDESPNQIYTAKIDGTEVAAITQNSYDHALPDWQPLPGRPSIPVATPPRDTQPPQVKAFASSGRFGSDLKLRFSVTDDSKKAKVELSVYRGKKLLWQIAYPYVFTADGSTATQLYRPDGSGPLTFCVQAKDLAGNASTISCAKAD